MLRFSRRKRKALMIDLAPLVDMVFLLLIFFLLTSSFPNPAINLELPTGTNTEKRKRPPIVITVDANENIFLNLDKVTLDSLKPKLRKLITETGERKVTFRGDRNIRYELFVKAADMAKSAGAQDINIVHQLEIEE